MVPPVILLVFLLTVDLGDTSCFQVDFPSNAKGCLLDNNFYEQGRRWKPDDCQDCVCFENHMTCCLSYLIPSTFDKKDCIDIFDAKSCVFHIVKKSDPNEKCEIVSASG